MRWIAALVLAVAFVGASCTNDEPEAPAASIADDLGEDEFVLEGVAVDAKAGVKPSTEIAGMMDDANVGGIAIRPEGELDAQGLDGCSTTRGAYVTYYTADTDAGDLRNADWPDNIEGQRVRAEGTRQEPEASPSATSSPAVSDLSGTCVLVLDRVELVTPSTSTDDGTSGRGSGTGSPRPGATGSPSASGEEVEGGFGSFPPHEDTDPIFEGTPSPDPCEGQKACEQHRETGQEPQP